MMATARRGWRRMLPQSFVGIFIGIRHNADQRRAPVPVITAPRRRHGPLSPRQAPRSKLASVNLTVFASTTTHLAAAGSAESPSTLEPAPGAGGFKRSAWRNRQPSQQNPTSNPTTSATTGWRDPFRGQRARYGPEAGFHWWQRLGAAVGLLALIGILGVLLAALVGFGAFVGGIALEALIG